MIKIDKKKDIENATVQKSTCQSTEGHSATQNGQEAAESFIATVSVQYRIQSPVARLTATSLTMRLYWSTKNMWYIYIYIYIYQLSYHSNLNQLLEYLSDCLNFWLLKSNIEVRQDPPEFLNSHIWSIHVITLDIDWQWNIFSPYMFCLMLKEQIINLKKVRKEKLKFQVRTDLGDPVESLYGYALLSLLFGHSILKSSL